VRHTGGARPLNSGVSLHMRPSRKTGAIVGTIGLCVSLLCILIFLAFTPAIVVALIVGLPAAGCAWASGRRLLAAVGVVAAMLPNVFIFIESPHVNHAIVVAVIAAMAWLVSWLAWLRFPAVVQANNSLQRP
jgi:hypothetical protein